MLYGIKNTGDSFDWSKYTVNVPTESKPNRQISAAPVRLNQINIKRLKMLLLPPVETKLST
jgi:hypothetical protein